MATTRVFNLTIGGINVSEYVDFDSLTDVVQQAESGIWDYKVDSLSVTMDKDVLDEFGLTEYNVDGLYRKLAALRYYENDILGGAVGEISYDFVEEEVNVEIYSYGKIVNDIEIQETLENFTAGGDTIRYIIYQLLWLTNEQLEAEGWPFKLFNNIDDNPVNLVDFAFFRSLNSEAADTTPLTIGNPSGVYQKYNRSTQTSIDDSFWVVFRNPGVNRGYKGWRLTSDGIDPDDMFNYPDQLFPFSFSYRLADNWGEDSGIEDYLLSTYHFDSSSPTFKGKAKTGELYWTVVERYLFKIFLEQSDKFIYKYEAGVKTGEVQKDIAILTNSVTWVAPDRKMYFQTRDGRSGITNPKTAIELSYEVIDERENKLEIPDSIIVSDIVATDLRNYYNDYFNGIFKEYTALVDKDEFVESEFPLILKNLKVKARGQEIDLGIIIGASYQEDLIEFTTRKRLP